MVQDPDSMGYQAVKMALEVLAKGSLKNPNRVTDAVLVTRANRNEPRIQKLLVP
jgi:ABC-type sugar transport system substrate-binding protein